MIYKSLIVAEGVQLLCLIEKSLDACRYLQTYGAWHKAAWLAKVCHLSLWCMRKNLVASSRCEQDTFFKHVARVLQATLEGADALEVMKRWAEQLNTPHVNQKVGVF